MKKRRLWGIIGLSIITLGIYDIVWLAKIKKELNAKTRIHVPSIWLVAGPLLIFIVGILGFLIVSASKTVNSLNNTSQQFNSGNYSYGMNTATNAANGTSTTIIIFILLYVIGIILIISCGFYWLLKFSKAINEYTDGKMGKGETFLLLWTLNVFGILLVQDTFNDMINEGSIPGGAMDMPADPALQPTMQPPIPPQPMMAPAVNAAPVLQPTASSPVNAAPVPIAVQPVTVISPTTPATPAVTPLVQ